MDDDSSFDIDQKVSMVKDMLFTIAKFDGQITEEEQRLIDTVAGDVHKYFTLLAEGPLRELNPQVLNEQNYFNLDWISYVNLCNPSRQICASRLMNVNFLMRSNNYYRIYQPKISDLTECFLFIFY